MNSDQIDQLKKTIEIAIEKHVNGKMDKMNHKLDDYITADNQWKKDVTPSIEVMKQIQGFSSTTAYIVKFIIGMGSVSAIIIALIKWLKQ